MEEQQNVPQPNWTTWWNHSCCTGIPWLSVLHCLQQLQSGACSTSTTQLLSLTGVERHNAIRSSAQHSHFPLGFARDVRTLTVSLCEVGREGIQNTCEARAVRVNAPTHHESDISLKIDQISSSRRCKCVVAKL